MSLGHRWFRTLATVCCWGWTVGPAVSQQTAPTVRTEVRLVTVDVTVTNKDGAPVRGLTCPDFKLTEDRRLQALLLCEEHLALVGDAAFEGLSRTVAEPDVFTNATAPPLPPVWDVVLLDFLNAGTNDRWKLLAEVKEIMRRPMAGRRVAIFVLGDSLSLRSGFTDDTQRLAAAMRGLPGPVSGLGMTAATETLGAAPEQLRPDTGQTSVPGGNVGKASGIRNMGGSYDLSDDPVFTQPNDTRTLGMLGKVAAAGFEQRKRDLTLDAFRGIDIYIRGLPGHKNVLWITSSVPESFERAMNGTSDTLAEFDVLLADFARDRISLYPIEATGVVASAVVNAETSGFGVSTNSMAASRTANPTGAENSRRASLDELARRTGGHAFYGSNDVDLLLRKAMASGADYYTLTYRPQQASDDRFHSFHVSTPQSHFQLAYRTGYVASTPVALKQMAAGSAAVAQADAGTSSKTGDTEAQLTPAMYAMTRGLPVSTGVVFAVKTRRGATEKTAQLLDLDYRVNLEDIRWTKTDDGVAGDLRLMLVIYDGLNKVLDSKDLPVPVRIKAKEFEGMRKTGVVPLHQQVRLPPGGNLYLRVGIEDRNSGKIGTLEAGVAR